MDDPITNVMLHCGDTVKEPFSAVFAYWCERCDGAYAPALKHFHLDDLPPAILAWSVLVDVKPDEDDFVYRFWGSERRDLIGIELTGKSARGIPDAYMRDGNLREYRNIVATKRPVLCQTPITTTGGRAVVFETMRLPLSDDGINVAHIYSALNYLDLERPHYEFFGTEKTRFY